MDKLEVTEPNRSNLMVPDITGQDLILPKRSEVQKLSAKDVNATGAEEIFSAMVKFLGKTPTDQVHPLVPNEVNQLSVELLLVRTAQDILNGRYETLKKYATDVINLEIEIDGKDPLTDNGFLYSPQYDIKLSKEVSGNKLSVDVDLLEKILEPDQFHSVVNVVETVTTTSYPDGKVITNQSIVREINEEALEQEIKKGNIGMEQIVQAAVTGKVRTAFYVRQSK